MSKLYNEYLKLKSEDSNKIYLFKCGVFYYMLDEDAKLICKHFPLKLLYFTENVQKCSFPTSRLDYYIKRFETLNLDFCIIDNKYEKIENYNDYLNNEEIKNIVKQIVELDLNTISMKQSFEYLEKLQAKLKNIC